MNSKCPINELIAVLEALLAETHLDEDVVTQLHPLKHLLTRFTYKESQFIDLSAERDEYKREIEILLDETYARGLGSWKKGELVHLCHVVNAMINLITRGRKKGKVAKQLKLPTFFT